jgi:hypothetical protein
VGIACHLFDFRQHQFGTFAAGHYADMIHMEVKKVKPALFLAP